MRLLFCKTLILGFFLLAGPFSKTASAAASEAPQPSWKFIEQQLLEHKFKKNFIAEMKKHYSDEGFAEVLELNVLLFLRKSDYHGPQVSEDSASEVREFMRKYRTVLNTAEQRYKVPAEVIVSLIWLESRLGNNLGSYHVPSVYLHLLQAKRKPVIAYLKTKTRRFTDHVSKKQLKDIAVRAKRKSDWALQELRAVAKIHKWHWEIGKEFRGSFAGAFGMPQFIPSSYVVWARPYVAGTQPILSKPEDAIMSVGYYLKDHGWKSSSKKKRIQALMKYNNSRDYALAILDLANRTKQNKTLASTSEPNKSALSNSEGKPEELANEPDKL